MVEVFGDKVRFRSEGCRVFWGLGFRDIGFRYGALWV